MNKEIPVISLQRLPVYLNYLKSLPADKRYISSGHIALALGLGEVLVRKDLAYTSATGRPRVGYLTSELIGALEEFLCCNGSRAAIIVGFGALGKAIMGYGGFNNYGIEVVAAFDNDAAKAGQSYGGKPVYDVAQIKERVRQLGAELAVICVPAAYAQQTADICVDSGIKGLLNFAPVTLRVPDGVEVRQMDVAANLAILSSSID